MVLIQFTLRVDDIFNRGSPVRPRTILPLLDLCERLNSRLILNVIPRRLIEPPNLDGAMVRELLEAVQRGHEIIQHGYDHCCSQCGDTGHQTWCTKFNREQNREQELIQMQRGKEMLEAAVGRRVFVYGPTGVDLHTPQLLSVVKELGFLATTGTPTADHAEIGLKVVPTGSDYAFAARAGEEFAKALSELKAEFDRVLQSAVESNHPGYFQILLHDPFTRSGYENGATLDYVMQMLEYMNTRPGVSLRNVVSRDVLGLNDRDLAL
jgi:hypothetical protein